MLRKANWDKTLQRSLKFSDCRKSIRTQIRPSYRKNLSTSFCVCLVSWKQRNLEIRANIPKSCRRPVVTLVVFDKVVPCKSAFTAPNYVGHAHLPPLSHSWQVVTWCKSHLARSRLRFRPQEIWKRDYLQYTNWRRALMSRDVLSARFKCHFWR